jgi:perosamine synthetase
VDINPQTLNLDPDRIKAAITKKTRAILPVHVFGYPIDYRSIIQIAKSHHLGLVEDACEAIGATYQGKRVGAFGHPTVFAFYANKQITTGEGGAVLTDSKRDYELIKSLVNQGRDLTSPWLKHQRLGYNYRLAEIPSAIGIEQIKKIASILTARRRVAKWYRRLLGRQSGLTLPFPDDATHQRSWFVYVVQVPTRTIRNNLIGALATDGIQTKPYLTSLHLQPFVKRLFGYRRGDFPVCEYISDHSLALPFFTSMTLSQVEFVTTRLCYHLDRAFDNKQR